ncbi:MAG: isoprenylcysteine carboxylmethyltransferase family protein [bacterium]
MISPTLPSQVTRAGLFVGWMSFGALFFIRRRPGGRGTTAKRSSAGLVGLAIQGFGFACAWLGRPYPGSFGARPSPADLVLTVAVLGLMAWAVSFALAAVRTLGKQWALDARVLEKHALVTEGPYARVRHPIYTAMGAMLVATGLAMSPWWALAAGILTYGAGTVVRTRAEEALLLDAFGAEYEAYRARVPALLPWR